MDKRILFISESSESFLITAMERSLTEAGFTTIFSRPTPTDIAHVANLFNVFIVYLDSDDERYHLTLRYLQNLLSEEGKNRYLYLIGNPIEIEAAYKIIPRAIVSGDFKRPVNTTDLITQLNIIFSGYSYEPQNDEDEDGESKIDPNKRSILLVDDDSVLLRSMQGWLTKKYNVFIVNSGMNTISFLHERTVDLILLDYEMPVLSGLEVFQILKTEPATASIPVIFLTSKDDKALVTRVLEARPDGYLLKPVPPNILLQTVEDFFAKHA